MTHTITPVRAIPFIVTALILCGNPLPAQAAFGVCNTTEQSARVALGYFDGKDWASSGWWRVPAGQCTRILSTPLVARYYYLYAEHEAAGEPWYGDRGFCVTTDNNFTIAGRTECTARGYQRKAFFQIDTGQAAEWTEKLAD